MNARSIVISGMMDSDVLDKRQNDMLPGPSLGPPVGMSHNMFSGASGTGVQRNRLTHGIGCFYFRSGYMDIQIFGDILG